MKKTYPIELSLDDLDMLDDNVVVEVANSIGKGMWKHVTTINEAKPTSASQVVVVAPSPTPFPTTPSFFATKETILPSTSRVLHSQQVPKSNVHNASP